MTNKELKMGIIWNLFCFVVHCNCLQTVCSFHNFTIFYHMPYVFFVLKLIFGCKCKCSVCRKQDVHCKGLNRLATLVKGISHMPTISRQYNDKSLQF